MFSKYGSAQGKAGQCENIAIRVKVHMYRAAGVGAVDGQEGFAG